MTTKTIKLTNALLDYLIAISPKEPDILERLRKETLKLPAAQMQIAQEQGRFMALLLQMMGARKVVEVGVFTGYSSLVMASALPDDGKIIACDISEDYTRIAKRYWDEAGLAHKIDLRIAPAMDTLKELIATGYSNSIDFAFIDADKENIDTYFEQLLQLIRQGGVIAVDNVLWGGRVIKSDFNDTDTRAILRFNSKRSRDDRIVLSVVPIGDGLSLAMKR